MSIALVLETGQVCVRRADLPEASYQASLSSLTEFTKTRLLQFGVSAQDADDLAQEIMLSMMRQLPSFKVEQGTLESWITGFAKMSAKAWMRQRARRLKREVPLESAPGLASEEDSDQALFGAVHGALERLSLEDRRLIGLRFAHDMSSKQIAEHLGTTDMAIRKRLSRAIERVRQDGGLREALAL